MKKQVKKKTCCSKAACCCKPKKKKAKKGFTLIEMMVVIIIIGILSAFIIMSVVGVRQKAAASRATGEISQVKSIAEMANAEGCTELTFEKSGTTAVEIRCTSGAGYSATDFKAYTKLQLPPSGVTYNFTLGDTGSTNTVALTSSAITFGAGCGGSATGCKLSLSSKPKFNFQASGFSSSSATYSCAASGCSCSDVDKCNSL